MIRKLLIFAGVLLLGALIWVGCDDDLGPTGSSISFDPAPVAQYFPLAAGYSVVYEVVQSNGSSWIVTQEVGEKEAFLEYQAYPLHNWDAANRRSTGWIVVTDSALFYFENSNDSPEQILRLPLYPGQSWDRDDASALGRFADLQGGEVDPLDGTEDGTVSKDDVGDGNSGDDVGDGDDPAVLGPQIIVSGSSTMQVRSVERLELRNGDVYGGVICVANTNYADNYNYYWFAPGTGLVKYCLGVTDRDLNTAATTAEIVHRGVNSR